MQLQTYIPLQPQRDNPIDYKSNLLLLGSCFVENIGSKLNYFKFQNLQNPFGVLFHPKAIETLISNAVQKKEYFDEDVFFHNEQWHCFEAHSKLNNVSKEGLLKGLNGTISSTHQCINTSTHIIITLGTAWVYRHVETDKIVANCHKVPQKQFVKKLMRVDEIVESLENIVSLIKQANPKATIIFTVSPVRHVKDGFVENTQSKAHLITAVHQVINGPSIGVSGHYFPSYEIMMDELRGYRFYAEDMIHPNQTAINYIWEKFKEVWVSGITHKTMVEVDAIQKGLLHKPFNPQSEPYQIFAVALQERIKKLQLKHPYLKF